MMHNFLCWLGWHSWIYIPYIEQNYNIEWLHDVYGYKRKYCEHCEIEYKKDGDYKRWERVK